MNKLGLFYDDFDFFVSVGGSNMLRLLFVAAVSGFHKSIAELPFSTAARLGIIKIMATTYYVI